jgi:hypothetical protein
MTFVNFYVSLNIEKIASKHMSKINFFSMHNFYSCAIFHVENFALCIYIDMNHRQNIITELLIKVLRQQKTPISNKCHFLELHIIGGSITGSNTVSLRHVNFFIH